MPDISRYFDEEKYHKLFSFHLLLTCAPIPSFVYLYEGQYGIHVTQSLSLVFQLINIGSHYQYGSDDHAEFLCVVSREYPDNTGDKVTEPTDRAKVSHSQWRGVSVVFLWDAFKIRTSYLVVK